MENFVEFCIFRDYFFHYFHQAFRLLHSNSRITEAAQPPNCVNVQDYKDINNKKIVYIHILNWFQFSSDQIVKTKFAHPVVNWIDVIRVTVAFLENAEGHKFLQTIIFFVQRNIDFVVTPHSQLKITYWYNFGTWTV